MTDEVFRYQCCKCDSDIDIDKDKHFHEEITEWDGSSGYTQTDDWYCSMCWGRSRR